MWFIWQKISRRYKYLELNYSIIIINSYNNTIAENSMIRAWFLNGVVNNWYIHVSQNKKNMTITIWVQEYYLKNVSILETCWWNQEQGACHFN